MLVSLYFTHYRELVSDLFSHEAEIITVLHAMLYGQQLSTHFPTIGFRCVT